MRRNTTLALTIACQVIGIGAARAGALPLRDGLYASGNCIRGNPAALMETFSIVTATDATEAPAKGTRYISLEGGESCFLKNGTVKGTVFTEKAPCKSFGVSSVYKNAMPLAARVIAFEIVDESTVVYGGRQYKRCW